jgi:hypothetical protein
VLTFSSRGPRASSVAVYDGRECIGHVARAGHGEFEAVTAAGVSLGHFGSSKAALNELSLAHSLNSQRGCTPPPMA